MEISVYSKNFVVWGIPEQNTSSSRAVYPYHRLYTKVWICLLFDLHRLWQHA